MKEKMKNTIRRVLSVFAAIAMVLGVMGANVTPVMAENNNTITIENAQLGQKYQLYRLFNATTNESRQQGTSTTEGIAYNYTLEGDKNLETTVTYTGSDGKQHSVTGDKWFTQDEAGNITAKADTVDSSLATEEFQQWAKGFGEKVGNEQQVTGTTAGTLKFENLPDGYYFITSTMGTLLTVTSVAPDQTVRDKNGTPAVTKNETVKTSSVGDEVTYNVEINIPNGASNVVFHDTLGAGLDLQGDKQNVQIHKGDANGNLLKSEEDYFVNYWSSTQNTNKDNITITFSSAFLNTIPNTAENKQIVLYLSYNAKLNVQAGVNMPNTAWVTYGENSTSSIPSKVYESAFGFKVNKLDGNDNTALNGAQFVLSKKSDLGNLTENNYSQHSEDLLAFDESGQFTPGGTTKLFTANNSLTFKGLNDNENSNQVITYYLYEVKAPDGYEKLTGPVEIQIKPEFEVEVNNGTHVTSYTVRYKNSGASNWSEALKTDSTAVATGITEDHNINIINQEGTVLPSTGGIGTTIFYVIGGVIVAGAIVLLIARRRKNA